MDRATADDAAPSRSSGGTPPPPDDRELVASALTNPDAFAMLYRRHAADVHAYIQRRCGSAVLADDITAIAFEKALRNLRAFRWRDGGFRAWVFRIAGNELIDHARREHAGRQRDARLAAVAEAHAVDPAAAYDESQATLHHPGATPDALRVALAQLRPRYAEAIALRYLSGLEPGEAAAAMNLSKATFAVTLHRAMKALQLRLEVAP